MTKEALKKDYDFGKKDADLKVVDEQGNKEDLALLYAKLSNIMGNIGEIEKNGFNSYYNYEYPTAEDIKGALRPLLAREKVWLSSNVEGYRLTNVNTKKGSSTAIELKMQFTFRCGDTGAKLGLSYTGYALDSGDKFIYKAYTGCIKYFLINNFMLSAGEDPEMDSYNTVNDDYTSATDKRDNKSSQKTNPKPKPKSEPKKDKPKSKPKKKQESELLLQIREVWGLNPDIVSEVTFDYLDDLGKEKDISLLAELKDKQLQEVLDNISEKLEEESKDESDNLEVVKDNEDTDED